MMSLKSSIAAKTQCVFGYLNPEKIEIGSWMKLLECSETTEKSISSPFTISYLQKNHKCDVMIYNSAHVSC